MRVAQYVITYVSILGVLLLGFLYTNHVQAVQSANQRMSEQKFCQVVDLVVASYATNPSPITPLGRELGRDYVQLQHDLGCVK